MCLVPLHTQTHARARAHTHTHTHTRIHTYICTHTHTRTHTHTHTHSHTHTHVYAHTHTQTPTPLPYLSATPAASSPLSVYRDAPPSQEMKLPLISLMFLHQVFRQHRLNPHTVLLHGCLQLPSVLHSTLSPSHSTQSVQRFPSVFEMSLGATHLAAVLVLRTLTEPNTLYSFPSVFQICLSTCCTAFAVFLKLP